MWVGHQPTFERIVAEGGKSLTCGCIRLLAKGFAVDVSSNTSTFRFVLCAAASIVSLPLLVGCFFHADVPLQSAPPAAAAPDPPEKGLIRGPKSNSSKAETADNTKPTGTRGLLLRSGWYRIPPSAEESATGIYNEAFAKLENTGSRDVKFRYRHAGLEQLMARPASPSQQAELRDLAADGDRSVSVTAAIGRARQGDTAAVSGLVAAVEDEDLPLPARCAAAEALGQLPGDNVTLGLRTLTDRFGQFRPGASTGYQADLHAELLRALARHVDAADDPRFLEAVHVPSVQVRIEVLRAWTAGTRGMMPTEIVDLRSDGDPRVPRPHWRHWPRENTRPPAIT